MKEYYKYIRWVYKKSFQVWPKDNAIKQRINRCGITIIEY